MPLLALVLAGCLLAASPVAADMEVYRPKHRPGEDLVGMVEAAMGAEGSVAVDGHTGALVLLGSPAAIDQALALLALQDRRLRMVRIEHETRGVEELRSAGYRLVWSAGGDDLRVGNVEHGSSGAAVVLREGRGSGTTSRADTVNVLEGEWGRISQGSEVLLPTGSRRHPDAVRVAADSGLEVRPRILGDGRVRLDLRPFQGMLLSGGAVARSGAETTLVVTPGRTAVVGGIGRAGQATSRSLASGSGSDASQRETVLLVTVTLDDDAPDPEGP